MRRCARRKQERNPARISAAPPEWPRLSPQRSPTNLARRRSTSTRLTRRHSTPNYSCLAPIVCGTHFFGSIAVRVEDGVQLHSFIAAPGDVLEEELFSFRRPFRHRATRRHARPGEEDFLDSIRVFLADFAERRVIEPSYGKRPPRVRYGILLVHLTSKRRVRAHGSLCAFQRCVRLILAQ